MSRTDPRGPTYEELFRHQCEVRYVIQRRAQSSSAAQTYLDGVEKQRGAASRRRLEQDAREQWSRGNRGAKDDWRYV